MASARHSALTSNPADARTAKEEGLELSFEPLRVSVSVVVSFVETVVDTAHIDHTTASWLRVPWLANA